MASKSTSVQSKTRPTGEDLKNTIINARMDLDTVNVVLADIEIHSPSQAHGPLGKASDHIEEARFWLQKVLAELGITFPEQYEHTSKGKKRSVATIRR